MSLIYCQECGNQISDQAKACPSCGISLKKRQGSKGKSKSLAIIVILLGIGAWYLLGRLAVSSISSQEFNKALSIYKTACNEWEQEKGSIAKLEVMKARLNEIKQFMIQNKGSLKNTPDFAYDKRFNEIIKEETRLKSMKVVNLKIRANQNWQNSGIEITPGYLVEISAEGQWICEKGDLVGPNGYENSPATLSYYRESPYHNFGSLIWLTSGSNVYGGLSEKGRVFENAQTGEILLKINDRSLLDNSGEMSVSIVAYKR